jgi:hypothetical protein
MKKSMGRTALLACTFLALALGDSARADREEEKKKLYQCAKDLCCIILSKNPKGPDLVCDVTKTWDKDQLQKGADSKNIGWGLGSATCSAKFTIKRADIVAALTSPEAKFKPGRQSVSCQVGTDQYPISATLSPELKFKNGTSTSGSLRIEDVQGAVLIKGAVWTAAQLERHFGIFEKDLVREVNRFLQKECPKWVTAGK